MAIEITLTPRKIERLFLITLLLIFMGTTIFYSYKASNAPSITGNAVAIVPESGAEETPAEQQAADETPEQEVQAAPAESQTVQEEEPPTEEPKALSGTFSVEIAPIQYGVTDAGAWGDKAEIRSVAFVIENGLSREVMPTVRIFAFDKESSESHKIYPKDTISLPLLASGGTLVKGYPIKNLNLYNFELTKTLRFEFVDQEDNQLAIVSKSINLES